MIKKLTPLILSISTLTCAPTPAPQNVPTPEKNSPFFETSFLFWVANQQGNEFAATGSTITVPGTADPNTALTPPPISSAGEVIAPNRTIEPGFKIGAGTHLTHGSWDLVGEYTYLFSKGSNSVETNNLNSGIIPLFSYTPNNSILGTTTYANSTTATNFVSGASGRWSLHFNTVSAELRREWSPVKQLVLKPHFGLLGTWQKQGLTIVYDVSSFTTLLSAGENKVSFNQTSWGIGPRFGLDGSWKVCKSLALVIDTAFSAPWGQYKAHGRSYDTNSFVGYTNVLISDQKYDCYVVTPVIEALLGLEGSWSFSNHYRFLCQIAWEEQIWFNQNQHGTVLPDSTLTLQGLSAKVAFYF